MKPDEWRPAVSHPGSQDIGVFEGIECSHEEIAIHDFPTGVMNRPSERTRGMRSSRVGVWGHRSFQR
jgi:hypothetical protein